MKTYKVVYSQRNAEFSVIYQTPGDAIWHEHSGPYNTPDTAIEVAEALTIKAQYDGQ